MNDFNNNKSRLDKLQEQIYDNDFESEAGQRSRLDQQDYKVGQTWVEEEKPEKEQPPQHVDLSEDFVEKPKGMGFFGYVMILAIIFFLGSVSYAAYVFLGNGDNVSAGDVDISVAGPVSVGAGEILSIDLLIQNNNAVQLDAVDLIVEYPDGAKDPQDLITDLNRTRDRVEPIAPGEILRETITTALFGEEGENKEISVFVEYQVAGSNAIFNKKKVFSIILNAAPARIAISGLNEVSSGQEIELEAEITSNSNTEIKNLMVTAHYPFGFDFVEADTDPTYSDNVWVIDSLSPNDKKTIKIKGTITGQNTEQRVFRFSAGLVSEENEQEIGVVFNNYIHEISLQRPFVDLNLNINGSTEPVVVVNSGNRVSSNLTFSNNTNDFIRDLDIRLNIEGDILDEKTVQSSQGFYRSVDNTLIFNSDTNSNLREIQPRKSYAADFSFALKKLINSGIDIRNPEVKITAYLEGNRISEDAVEEELKETFTKIIKVESDVFLRSYTLRNMGPFENTGPIPPKAEQETTYTIKWSITNNSNNIRNARLTALLPNYISWNNKVSPSSEDYIYDENTKSITWNIGDIPANTGITNDPRELDFQVTFLPSLTQIGQKPELLRDVFFTAEDAFTNTEITISGKAPNTALSDGSTVNNHETVIE